MHFERGGRGCPNAWLEIAWTVHVASHHMWLGLVIRDAGGMFLADMFLASRCPSYFYTYRRTMGLGQDVRALFVPKVMTLRHLGLSVFRSAMSLVSHARIRESSAAESLPSSSTFPNPVSYTHLRAHET